MNNPLKALSVKDWCLWGISIFIVTISNIATGNVDYLTLIATWVGITSLIFASKGNVLAQILMIVFSVLYGVISFRFRYWGEMITYLGMSMPMAIWSTITWIKNPSIDGTGEVAIQRLKKSQVLVLTICSIVVTGVFYFVLRLLNTPNIVFSTISVTTSFFATSLTMLRSSYYAIGYAMNDLVLIVLWSLATIENPIYMPVVINFIIFFINDIYGFINWKKRENIQFSDTSKAID